MSRFWPDRARLEALLDEMRRAAGWREAILPLAFVDRLCAWRPPPDEAAVVLGVRLIDAPIGDEFLIRLVTPDAHEAIDSAVTMFSAPPASLHKRWTRITVEVPRGSHVEFWGPPGTHGWFRVRTLVQLPPQVPAP